MTVHDSDAGTGARGILRWLGIGTPRPADEAAQPEASHTEAPLSAALSHETRQRLLLDDIAGFLLTHRLEVTPMTLTAAFDAKSGADPAFARMIGDRAAHGEPITMEWLRHTGRDRGQAGTLAAVDALVQRFETGIEAFVGTTQAARSATHDYSTALQAHVEELGSGDDGDVLARLATVARVMLDHTRAVEAELALSEVQTRELRTRLDEARRAAEIDHLTGLPNRRAFETAFQRELTTAKANKQPLCVAFCDIDNFKRINDTHGHDAGDRVLRAVAQSLERIARSGCHVARHGGEEFALLFRGSTLDEAAAILDDARQAMANRRLVNRATDTPFGQVTFSAGVAAIADHPDPRTALKAADVALYQAKATGRNRVCRAEPGDAGTLYRPQSPA